MDKDTKEWIMQLAELYKTQGDSSGRTFLEIIGRARDEDLISRMLAYILETDTDLCKALFYFYSEQKNKDWDLGDFTPIAVSCEKNMGSGRADIFIEAKGYTMTIENKIDTWEHDYQTETYFDFVSANFCNTENGFIYLKPDYNDSSPNNDNFVVLTYGALLKMINLSKSNNIFEIDFGRHIEKYLIKWNGNLMESDLIIYKHYKELKEMMNSAENKYRAAKQEVQKFLLNGELFNNVPIRNYRNIEEQGVFVSDITKDIWHRIFRNKQWRNDEISDDKQKYYFYLELVMQDDPSDIVTQMVIRCYGKQGDSLVYRFMQEKGHALIAGSWSNHWFVSSPNGKFVSAREILSNEWMNDLTEYIDRTMREYLMSIEKLFTVFIEWKNGKSI